MGLSNALCATIPIMELVKELKGQGYDMLSTHPMIHCQVFEDNSGALKIAKVPKMQPQTKHINIKFHHFQDYVMRGEITLHAISTHSQPADMLTKLLNKPILNHHSATIMGWGRKGNVERECEDIPSCRQLASNAGKNQGYQGYAGPLYQACMQGYTQPVWAYHNQAKPE